MVAVAFISQVQDTSSVSNRAGGPQHSTDLEQSLLNSCCWDNALGPVPEHSAHEIFPAACGV